MVDKFEDWTCASRFTSYKSRQKEFLFVKKNKATGHYYPLGAGNEGEVPIIDNFVYYRGQYLAIDTATKVYNVYSGIVRGYRYKKSEFIQAIRDFSGRQEPAADTTANEVTRRLIAELHVYNR